MTLPSEWFTEESGRLFGGIQDDAESAQRARSERSRFVSLVVGSERVPSEILGLNDVEYLRLEARDYPSLDLGELAGRLTKLKSVHLFGTWSQVEMAPDVRVSVDFASYDSIGAGDRGRVTGASVECDGALPSWVFELESLERLSVRGFSRGARIPYDWPEGLTSLFVSEMIAPKGKIVVPEQVRHFGWDLVRPFQWPGFLAAHDLLTLSITETLFGPVPASIAQFGSLEALVLSNNGLRSLPDEIWALSRLERLELSGNPIGSVPDAIERLTDLKHLALDWTNIHELPRGLPSSI